MRWKASRRSGQRQGNGSRRRDGSRETDPWQLNAAIVTVLVLVAGYAAACGGSAGSPGEPPGYVNGSPGSPLAFVRCMRANGMPSFPEPEDGQFNLAGINQNSPKLRHAAAVCGASDSNTGAEQQSVDVVRGLKFARCMRAHGVTNFPDPKPNPDGRQTVHGTTHNGAAPVFQRAVTACRPLLAGRESTAANSP